MNPNKVRGLISVVIILGVFTVIAFVTPFFKSTTFWIAYVSGVIAIVLQTYFLSVSLVNGKNAKSKFYGFPIAKLAVIYLLVQLGVSIIEMCLAKYIPGWIATIINIIILAIILLGCIVTETVRDEIERQDVLLTKNVATMRNLQSLAATLVEMSKDEATVSELCVIADELKYSDPVSSKKTEDLEYEIEVQLKELQQMIVDGDITNVNVTCARIKVLITERNRVCSLSK